MPCERTPHMRCRARRKNHSATRSITVAALMNCLLFASSFALGLADLTNQDAARGIKGALADGAAAAVGKLGYVSTKALDGLYVMIGEEEHAIRQHPAAAGSAIVAKVFGALR